MKTYTKPSMTIAKFGSKEDIATGSVYGLQAQFVETENSPEFGTISVFEITSLGANS